MEGRFGSASPYPAGAQAPGSPATINAADHPDLQAAFDALPEEGGVVRIPPGNYDITEPLVLSKPETRVEGSGAATHIRNRNEEGEPALIVRHPKRESAQIP